MRTTFNDCILLLLSSERSMRLPTNSIYAAISTSPHVRPIALISFSTVLRRVDVSLPCFFSPWGVHLRATLVILLRAILKTCMSFRRRRFLIFVLISSEIVAACKSKFEMVLSQKSDRFCVGIHCETPRSKISLQIPPLLTLENQFY